MCTSKQNTQLIQALVDNEVIKKGHFVLKSGITSNIYIDLRLLTSSPKSMKLLASSLSNLVKEKSIDKTINHNKGKIHIVGCAYAGIPIASILSIYVDVSMLIVRKERKTYGTKSLIEGKYNQGDNVILIDDIITTGSSLIDNYNVLKDHGLNVICGLIVIDRRDGNINVDLPFDVHCLLSLNQINSQINDQMIGDTTIRIPRLVKKLNSFEKNNNVIGSKLCDIMIKKQSNLCLSCDLTTTKEILSLIDLIGQEICLLKIHYDIITDYNDAFVLELCSLKIKHNFLIMEDRKFVDIGHCTQMQLNNLMKPVQWFDMITVVPISGPDIIEVLAENFSQLQINCGMVLVREMSTRQNHLANNYDYQIMVDRFRTNKYVTGVVSQSDENSDIDFKMTPGVSFETGTDNKGQQYRTVEDAIQTGTDIIIVGRNIYSKKTDEEKLTTVNKFRETAWKLYN